MSVESDWEERSRERGRGRRREAGRGKGGREVRDIKTHRARAHTHKTLRAGLDTWKLAHPPRRDVPSSSASNTFCRKKTGVSYMPPDSKRGGAERYLRCCGIFLTVRQDGSL